MQISTVMIIDDDVSIRTVAEMILRKVGQWNVIKAESGARGLEILQSSPVQPDVILLDLMMPGMDGFTVLAAIRQKRSLDGIPIIFMTAKKIEKEDAEGYGATGLIAKPFDPMQLPAEINAICAKCSSVA